jgi:hypothetical protein
VPHINSWEPYYFAKVPDGPQLILLISSGSKKEPRYACLSEAKASHSQRMWAEISSSAVHLLHSGLSSSVSSWRCLLRVLYPVRKPLRALDWVLLKDRNLALAPRQGPEIGSWACLWVSPRSHWLPQIVARRLCLVQQISFSRLLIIAYHVNTNCEGFTWFCWLNLWIITFSAE